MIHKPSLFETEGCGGRSDQYRKAAAFRRAAHQGLGFRLGLFLSRHVNKVDRKGRVSVPAPFRAALVSEAYQGLILFRSLQHQALEGCSLEQMQKLSAALDTADLPPDQKELWATTIFGGSQAVPFDSEGRIVLPQDLSEFAEIDDAATFIGMGTTFQIWAPKAFTAHETAMRKQARSQGMSLRMISAGGPGKTKGGAS